MHHPITWLRHAGQHLGLVPSLGGAVAAWQCEHGGRRVDLWRPWDGQGHDLYRLASFPMVPWSNRIAQGGFEQDGRFHAMQPNRAGEPYPIHGDGWLQPWQLLRDGEDAATLALTSRHFGGNPFHYEATQRFRLVPGGLDQTLRVRHLGDVPMPYGLGLHPWFERTPGTTVQASVQGLWTSGDDPIPTGHVRDIPADRDLAAGISAHGSLIDNAYSGWGGHATIAWPERGLRLQLAMPQFARDGGAAAHQCLVYRPPAHVSGFCLEPITHPIDAFHLPGRPGLRVLVRGERMELAVQWRWSAIEA